MLCILSVLLLWALPVSAASQESKDVARFSDGEIVKAVENYVKEHSVESGTFDIYDIKEKVTRKLSLERVQEDIRKTGENYIACVDFKDTESGDNLDIDVVLGNMEGALKVVDARIHKINGVSRDSYNSEGVYMPSTAGIGSSGQADTNVEQPLAEPGNQARQEPSVGNVSSGGSGIDVSNPQPGSSEEPPVTVVLPDSGPQF